MLFRSRYLLIDGMAAMKLSVNVGFYLRVLKRLRIYPVSYTHLGKMNHHHVDALQTSQWTTGRLSFVNASVPEIMKAIERKYDVRIVINSKFVRREDELICPRCV